MLIGCWRRRALRRIAPAGSLTNVQCADCAARARCENRCACVNLATTGDVNRVSAVVCHHERMVIETADAAAAELFAERNPAFLARFYQTHARLRQGYHLGGQPLTRHQAHGH
jgi:hypothetical protein